jgi:competence protein ComEA
MRSRASDSRTADSADAVVQRRLEALIAELTESRGGLPSPAGSQPTGGADVPEPRPSADDSPNAGGVPAGGRHAHRPLSAGHRVAAWIGDRLPASVHGRLPVGAAHLGAAQFGLVVLVVAVGLVIGAWWLVRAGGSSGEAGELAPPRPITASSPSAPASPAPAPAGPGGSTTAQPAAEGQIVVDVVGKVRRPGIAVLPAGSRVVDAVRAAGGMRPGVDPTTVNMARPLTDGEQIVIGVRGAAAASGMPGSPPAPSADAGGGLVNLNTADQAALETLPGVGPVTAAAILEWRAEHGGFSSVDELLEVSGIGDATLAEIAPHVTL